MDLPTFEQLLTPGGQVCLAEAAALEPTELTFLAHVTRLQKRWPAALATAALETVLLRERARAKFGRAEAMYFTREALEQASTERVAGYRAERFGRLAAGRAPEAFRVADLGCGIGGDTLALAEFGPVVAVERDPLRLAMAGANAAAYGRAARVQRLQADLATLEWPGAQAFFFDPARRSGGRRRFSVEAYEPPLSAVRGWLAHAQAGAVKLSPGVDLAELAAYPGEVEFISERGELKECALWLGALKSAERRATLLSAAGPHTLLPNPAAAQVLGPPDAWLYEPDPAVLRAGLVTTLAAGLGAHQLDPDIAYLAAAQRQPTPFARAFAIEAAMPFQLKRLRQHLRALGVGTLTVKKRGSPLEPEALIRQLKLTGSESRTVFLTHVAGEPWVLIGQPARP